MPHGLTFTNVLIYISINHEALWFHRICLNHTKLVRILRVVVVPNRGIYKTLREITENHRSIVDDPYTHISNNLRICLEVVVSTVGDRMHKYVVSSRICLQNVVYARTGTSNTFCM